MKRKAKRSWKKVFTYSNDEMIERKDTANLIIFNSLNMSAFRSRGVPGPTSKLSLRVPAQMCRRETEHKGSKKGNRGSCCPAPRADALAVGGYKRSRGRERACPSARSRARPPSRTRALDLPFIVVRRRPRCIIGGCSNVLTCLAERSQSPMYMPSWQSERC
jgi:hypothetical protein